MPSHVQESMPSIVTELKAANFCEVTEGVQRVDFDHQRPRNRNMTIAAVAVAGVLRRPLPWGLDSPLVN